METQQQKSFTVCIDFTDCKHSYVDRITSADKEQAKEQATRFARQCGYTGPIKKIKVLEAA